MSKEIKTQHVERTQKDYSLSFKLSVVEEIERGELSKRGAMLKYGIQGHETISTWLEKFDTFDYSNQSPIAISDMPEQKLLELEQKKNLRYQSEKSIHPSSKRIFSRKKNSNIFCLWTTWGKQTGLLPE